MILSPFARRILDSATLPEAGPLLVACSGGADSLALVLGLDELRRATGLAFAVAHVHHGLRHAEADADAARVAALCEGLGAPFHLRRCDAAGVAARRRRGIEEAARHVRHEALESLRVSEGCAAIALAHTADDQAETVLLRLLRGSGAEGLGGMAPVSGTRVRPLLAVRRAETRAFCHASGVAWASDATNWSPASARALVREWLERLEAALDEGIVDRLCEMAAQLRDESACLDALASELLAGRVQAERGVEGVPRVRIRDPERVGDAHPALARRAVRRLLRDLRPGEPPPDADAVRRALRLFGAPPRPTSALLHGLVLRRAGREVVAGPETPWRPPAEPVPLVPGSPVRWLGGVLAMTPVGAMPLPADGAPPPLRRGARVVLDGDALAGGACVRVRRPGDRLMVGGDARRVSGLMAALGVPVAWRDAHPLVCLASGAATIVWLPGGDADAAFLATPTSKSAFELTWTSTEPGAEANA